MNKPQTKPEEKTWKRSPCPVACALDILGDKWTLLVIRDLFRGRTMYSEFQSGPENIPTNILAARLKRLEKAGIVEKKQYQQRPPRYSYHLSGKGKDLGPVLKSLVTWSNKHLAYTLKVES